jgi:hypothetical protein
MLEEIKAIERPKLKKQRAQFLAKIVELMKELNIDMTAENPRLVIPAGITLASQLSMCGFEQELETRSKSILNKIIVKVQKEITEEESCDTTPKTATSPKRKQAGARAARNGVK